MRFALLFLLVLGGCVSEKEVMDLRFAVLSHGTEISELRAHNFRLQREINEMQNKAVGESIYSGSQEAEFGPDSTGYQIVKTTAGTFMVSIRKISPYADGQRVTFRIGNPYAASYSDPKITVRWGRRFSFKEGVGFDDWEKSLRKKEVPLVSTELRAGTWTDVQAVLSPATPEEVGHLAFSLVPDVISMRVR